MRRAWLAALLFLSLGLQRTSEAGTDAADAPPAAPAAKANTGTRTDFVVFRRSTLERVDQDSQPRADEIVADVQVQATLDEYEPLQLAVYPRRTLAAMEVTVTDLTSKEGHALSAKEVGVRMERYYNQPLSMDDHKHFGIVPKTLEIAPPITVPEKQTRPYWITIHVPRDQLAGEYQGSIHFKHRDGEIELPLHVEVVPLRLEEPKAILGPICVGALANLWKTLSPGDDSLQTKAGRRGLTLEHADLMFDDMRKHGMTALSLRSGSSYTELNGHPYLPEVEAAIDAYKKYHFPEPMVYCLGYLLKTNKAERSSNYRDFKSDVHLPMARRVAEYYTRRFRDEGLPGILFMPIEEPNKTKGVARSDSADARAKLVKPLNEAIKEAGGSTAMTCTPESITFAGGYVDHWIAAYKKFSTTLYESSAQSHARLGLYANGTLMGQGTYFTRFFFGYFTWANHLDSMLPWTYPLSPKRFPKNVKDRGEGPLELRDGFLGADGKPVPTIQWELARQGIDDAKYMVTIEQMAKVARASNTPAAIAAADRADRFLDGIRQLIGNDPRRYTFADPRTFEPQPEDGWNAARFEQTRAEALEILKQLAPYANASSATKN